MEALVSNIESLAYLSPILPPVIKASIIAFIILIFSVPIGLLFYFIAGGAKSGFILFENKLTDLSAVASSTAKKMMARRNRLMRTWIKANRSFVEYENPSFRFDTQNLQKDIDALSAQLPQMRQIIDDEEQEKKNILQELNERLEALKLDLSPLKEVEIPSIEIEASQEAKRRSAQSGLIVFGFLTIAAMAINAMLVGNFFKDIFLVGNSPKVLGDIRMHNIYGALFSIIEVGVGAGLAFIAKETVSRPITSNDKISIGILWAVTIMFAILEAAMYAMYMAGDYGEPVGQFFTTWDFRLFFEKNLYFGFLGLAIVLILAQLGKLFMSGYFEFSKYSTFNAFKNDLDELYNHQSELIEVFDRADNEISELLERAKSADLSIGENGRQDAVDALDALRSLLETLSSEADKVSKIKIDGPELTHVDLSHQETQNIMVSRIFIGLIPAFALASFIFIVPTSSFFEMISPIYRLFFDSMSALALVGGVYFAGYVFTRNVSVLRRQSEDSAYLISKKPDLLAKLGAVSIVLLAATTTYFILDQGDFGLPRTCVAIFVLAVSFYCGRDLLNSITVLAIFGKSVLLQINSMILIAISAIANALKFLNDALKVVIDFAAYPAEWIFTKLKWDARG